MIRYLATQGQTYHEGKEEEDEELYEDEDMNADDENQDGCVYTPTAV